MFIQPFFCQYNSIWGYFFTIDQGKNRFFQADSYVKFAYEVKFFFYTFAYFFRHRYKKSQSLGSLGSLFLVIAIVP